LTIAVGGARTQAALTADWEPTGLGGRVLQLFTPASGAFFALSEEGLFRSDDAGTTWAPVSLPPLPADVPVARTRIAVDPTDHAILYAGGADGIYKSTDAAASWTLVLPTPERNFSRALSIAPSAADRNLVYLALTGPSISADFRFLRSRDGGATWEQLEQVQNTLCGWGVLILQPHPTDARRAFRTADCYAGRNLQDSLDQSMDQGQTWSAVLRPEVSFPTWLVGGREVAPARFYLASNNDARRGGSSVFRSDDDGATWTDVLRFRGGGTIEQPDAPNVWAGGLAYDPARPDRVYVGLRRSVGWSQDRIFLGSGVRASADGGAAWFELGRQDLPEIHDLALGIDRSNLYAATERGLWRLDLRAIPIPQIPKR